MDEGTARMHRQLTANVQTLSHMVEGAVQCSNHLSIALQVWDECEPDEQRRMVEEALERLTRVGV